jgi:uncharacterized integral membrane protein
VSKVFFWIIAAPLAVAIIVFSVNNRGEVVLDLWPLDMVTAPLPIFPVVLASLLTGFVLGGVVAWFSGAETRKRARQVSRRAEAAEHKLARAEERIVRLEQEAGDDIRRLPGDAA